MTANQTAINTLIEQLRQQGFDEHQIKTDADSLGFWGKDWTKHFEPNASAIVFPKSTQQVQAIVKLCNALNYPKRWTDGSIRRGSCRQWRGSD